MTDSDGSTASSTFHISVVDDVPTAVDDVTQTLKEGGESVSGNVMANDIRGADDPVTVTEITYTDESGQQVTASVDPVNGVTVDTQYGSLTIAADGSYTYTSDANETHTNGQPLTEGFTYTITDNDGDSSSAVQAFTITDDGPTITPPTPPTTPPTGDENDPSIGAGEFLVDEDDLGSESGDLVTGSDGSQDSSTSGTLDIDGGADGIASVMLSIPQGLIDMNLTSGGTPVTYTLSQDGQSITGSAGGESVFTLTLSGNPTDGYGFNFDLTGVLDHPTGQGQNVINDLPFDITVTDGDGGTATATLQIDVVDDVPVAHDDGVVTVGECTSGGGGGDLPEMSHDISNIVLYLADNTTGEITKVKIEAFDQMDGVRDPDHLPIQQFVDANYPNSSLVAGLTVKAGNNKTPGYGPGEGELFITDDGYTAADLPTAAHADVEWTAANAFAGMYIGPNNPSLLSDGATVSVTVGTDQGSPNLLANDKLGADGGSITSFTYTGEDGQQHEALAGETVDTIHGTLTVNADGTWSYTVDQNVANDAGDASDTFTYTLTDGDGDTSTASQTIVITDGCIGINLGAAATATLDEDDLRTAAGDAVNGSDGSQDSVVTKSFDVEYGADGPAAVNPIVLSAPQALQDMGLTSGGTAVSYTVSADGLTLTASAGGETVFTVSLSGDPASGTMSYTFDLVGQLDHPAGAGENVLSMPVAITITDSDGSQASGTVSLSVVDDVPAVANDAPVIGQAEFVSVDEDDLADGTDGSQSTSVSGDLGFGSGAVIAIDYGADGPAAGAPAGIGYSDLDFTIEGPAGLTSQGEAVTYSQNGNVLTAEAGGRTVFTVELNADGSFTFDLQDSLDHADGAGQNAMDLGFTLTGVPSAAAIAAAVDGDGDPVQGLDTASVTQTISVSVVDDVPVATANDLTGEPEVVTVTITAENYSETGTGFTVTGRQINPDGTLTDKSGALVSTNANPPGFGVTGPASGADSEIGYSDNHGISEELHIDFDTPITEVTISYSWMNSQEDGTYTLYRDGQPVGTATVDGVTDQIDAAFTATADDGGPFDSIVFTAPSGGGHDFLVHSVQFEQTVTGGGVVSEQVTLDEDDLIDGSDLDKEGLTANGNLNLVGEELVTIDYGADGPAAGAPTGLGYGDLTFTIDGPAGLTSQGEAITYDNSTPGELVATAGGREVFTVTLNADGSFSFTLKDTIDHATGAGENVQALTFGLTGVPNAGAITDYDLDPASFDGVAFTHSFQVNVVDDVPTAVDDSAGPVEEGQSVSGNVMTSNDTEGADGATVTSFTYKDANGQTMSVTVDPQNGGTATTEAGTLTVMADGSYTFTANGDVVSGGDTHVESFGYTLTDADGDTSSATLNVTITDDDEPTIEIFYPNAGPGGAAVDEDDLGSEAGDTDQGTDQSDPSSVSGTIQLNFGEDGFGSIALSVPAELEGRNLTSGGQPVSYEVSGDGLTITASAGGETVFTMTLTGNAQDGFGWTFDLTGNLDHAAGQGENVISDLPFTVTVTDSDGDAASGTIEVDVVDDVPVATANTVPVDGNEEQIIQVTNMGQESAAYNNTYGYYVKGPNGEPTEGKIIFANTKQDIGETYTIEGHDPADIGFFVISNGASLNGGISNGMTVTFEQDNSGNWHAVADGSRLSGQGDPVLFDDPALNENNFDYTVDNQVAGNQNWEDIPGGGDNDFNDVNINVEVITTTTIPTVDEDDLADGSSPDAGALAVNGNLGLAGEELISIDYGADGAAAGAPTGLGYSDLTFTIEGPAGLTSQGDAVTYQQNGDVLTATAGGRDVFTVQLNADGTFTFTLKGSIDHQNGAGQNVQALTFGLIGIPTAAAAASAEDFDFDPASFDGVQFTHSFQVNVIDDVPLAVDDGQVTLDEGGVTVTGQLMGNDVAGADGASVTSFTYTDVNGDTQTGVVGQEVQTEYGTLTVQADGSYSYTSNTSVDNPNGAAVTDAITYTITDADGDTSSATHSFEIEDTLPQLSLQIGPAEGYEDQPIGLSISADLAEANNAVTVGVTLGNVPTDAVLVTGTGQTLTGSSSYALTPDDLEGLTIQAGLHSADDFGITVTATATHSVTGETFTTDPMPLPVTVHEIADGPTLSVTADVVAVGDEGTDDILIGGAGSDTLLGGAGDDTIDGQGGNDLLIGDEYDGFMSAALNIGVGLIDQDGSEVASLTLSGLPEGATLSSDNGAITVTNGTAQLSVADLQGLTVTFPAGTAAFDITVAARTVDTDADDNTTDTSADVVQTISVSLPGGDGYGDDTIVGGAGDDTIYGNRGDDILHGDGPDACPPNHEIVSGTQEVFVTDRGPFISIGEDSGNGDIGEPGEAGHVSEGGYTVTGTLAGVGAGVVTSITYTAEDGQALTALVDAANGVTVDTQYGMLTVNADGSFSYTSDHDEDHGASGAPLPDPFSFTATVPTGEFGEGEITAANYNETGAGFTVTARSLDENGNLTEASVDNVSTGSSTAGAAFGVRGNTGGPAGQLGYDAEDQASEELIVTFDQDVSGVTFSVANHYETESGGEVGRWVAYKDGNVVAQGDFIAPDGQNQATFSLDLPSGITIDQLVFSALPYAGGQSTTSDSSDYWITNITYQYGMDPGGDQTFNDTIYGEEGNDQLYGDKGNDILRGGADSDTVDGGKGIDDVHAGSEDDLGLFTVGEGGVGERYDGGTGTDTLRIKYSAADLQNPAIVQELREIQQFIADNSNPLTDSGAERTFSALGITVQDWEDVQLDGPPLPDPVDANDDTASVVEGGQTVTGNVLSNDDTGGGQITSFTYTKEDGSTGTASAGDTVDTVYGQLTVQADGSYTYTSDPSEDHSGGGLSEAVTYTVTNQYGSDDATLTINVGDTVPVAVNDVNSTVEGGQAVTGNLLANDDLGADGSTLTSFTYTDANGNPQTGVPGSTVTTQTGTLTVQANGTYSFTANASIDHSTDGQTEQEVFSYTITDGDGDMSTATATINIADTNPDLDVTASGGGYEDQWVPLDITYTATGEGPGDVSFTLSGVPAGATLNAGTEVSAGVWSLTEADLDGLALRATEDFSGEISLTLTADTTDVDGDTASDSETFTVFVAPVVDEIDLEVEDATAAPCDDPTEPGEGLRVTNMGQESAAYNNSYGYFIIGAGGVPTVGQILFANTKLEIGVTKEIEGVDPDSVGFFVISNGASLNPGLTNGTEITFQQDGSGNWVAHTANGPLSGQGDPVIFSTPGLNEGNFDYTQDNAVVGNQNWEDIPGGGDNDFNDVNMDVERYTIDAPDNGGVTADISGTVGDDVLTGTADDEVIAGGDGNDTIIGMGGDDTILGQGGRDVLYGDGGPDADGDGVVVVGQPTVVFQTSFENMPGDVQQSNPSYFAQSIEGWTTTAEDVEIWTDNLVRDLGDQPDGKTSAADGHNFVELNNVTSDVYSDSDGIYRDVPTEAGKVYELTFSYSGRPGYDETVNKMLVSVNGNTLGDYSHDMEHQTNHDWQTVTVTFTGNGSPMRIMFVENSDNDQAYGRGMSLDNIILTDTGTKIVSDIEGDSFNDTIYGGADNDQIYGQQGDDVIYGDDPLGQDYDGCFTAPVSITVGDNDIDGSEVLTIEIGNVPQGATLFNTAGDTFSGSQVHVLTPDQLEGLQIRVPNGTGDFTLSVEVTSLDTDPDRGETDTGTVSATIDIDIPDTSGGTGVPGDDTIYGGSGADTIYGQQGDDIIYGDNGPGMQAPGGGTPTPAPTPEPVEVSFGLTTPSYSDDPLNLYPSNGDSYAKGYTENGDYVVKIGGKDDCDICDMAGGYTTNFTVDDAATDGTLTFTYRMTFDRDYESNEYGEVWVAIDGQKVVLNGNDYIQKVSGNGNGGDDFDSGWQTVTIDIGNLSPGAHSVTLGGYNNAKTTQSEEMTVRFKDIEVTGMVGGEVGGGDTGSDVNAIFHFGLDDVTWSSNETVTDNVNGLTGTAKGGTGATSGPDGGAAQFDGDCDYIEVPHHASMETQTGTFTIDFLAWNNGTLASKDSYGYDDGGHFNMEIDSDREVKLRIQTDDETFYLEGGSIDYENWHNATVTWDGTTVSLYVDGNLVDSVASDWNMASNQNPWTFAASQTHSGDDTANNLRDYLSGRIDSPALFDGALTADQVASMVDNGTGYFIENIDSLGSEGTETLSLDITGTNVNTSAVVTAWGDAGVTLEALRYNAGTDSYTDAPFSTKNVSFTINSSHTADASIHGTYNYAGIAVGGGIDGGEIDTQDGSDDTGTEVMRMTFDTAMDSVTVTLSALFDGESQITADHGPFDPGYLEQARWVAYGPDGQSATGVINGTVNGLVSAKIDTNFPITKLELTPVDDGAGQSGHNSDFLLKGIVAVPVGSDVPDTPDGDVSYDDVIHGGTGNDQIHGQYGNDFLQGGSGNDIVAGGAGRDWIMGGTDSGSVNTAPQAITVTFQGTDAGYSNSVGYYVLDDEGTPETGEVIWANLHQTSVGSTHTILLDGFDQDDIGFFLIPDGGDMNAGLADGTVVTFGENTDGSVTVYADGQALQGQDANAYFSNPPTLNPDGLNHTQVTEIADGVGLTINADGKNGVLSADDVGFSGQKVTVEVGFKSTELGNDFTPLLSYSAGRNNGNEFTIGAQNGVLTILVAGVSVATNILASGLFDGDEHMVSASWDGTNGNLKVYVDGVEGFATTGIAQGQSIQGGGTLVFGQEQDSNGGGYDSDQVFSGTYTQARLFDDLRDPVEIAQSAGEPLPDDADNVVADYRFGGYDSGSKTVEDVSGNGNDLSYGTVSGFQSSSDPEVVVGGSGETLIGFEDLLNGGDQDYNDAILSVRPAPTAADFQAGDQLWGGEVGGTGDGEKDAFFYARGDGVDTIHDFEMGTDQLFISGYDRGEMTILKEGNDTIISLGDGGAIKLVGVDADLFGTDENIASYDADTDGSGALSIDELMELRDDVLADGGGQGGSAPPSAGDAGIVMVAPVEPGLTDAGGNEDPQNG
ncbi:MAG: Ig-like domain-containing protein [Pseudomonadota bacterium]|nr:Ig-like domain-containing protein [Pseudomonadota bacterium]